jgi:hypothetical protein
MRHLFAALAVIALSIGIALPPASTAPAKKKADPVFKAAERVVKKEAKAGVRAIKARGKATVKAFRLLAKRAKKGLGPGAKPGSPGKDELSAGDALNSTKAAVDESVSFRRGLEDICRSSYLNVATHPAVEALIQSNVTRKEIMPGHGGLLDEFAAILDDACQGEVQRARDAFEKFREELCSRGYVMGWTACPHPKLAPVITFIEGAPLYPAGMLDLYTLPDGSVCTTYSFPPETEGSWFVAAEGRNLNLTVAADSSDTSALPFREFPGEGTAFDSGACSASLLLETGSAPVSPNKAGEPSRVLADSLIRVSTIHGYVERSAPTGGGGGGNSDFPVGETFVSYRIDGALQNIPVLRAATLTYDNGELQSFDIQFEHAFIDVTLFRLTVTWPTPPDRIAPKTPIAIPLDDAGANPRAVVEIAERDAPEVTFTSADGGALAGQSIEFAADRDIAEFFAGRPDIFVRGTVRVRAPDGSTHEIEFRLGMNSDDVDR